MTKLPLLLRSTLLAPLALAVAACGGETEEEVSLDGAPIAAIAAPEGQQWTTTAAITPEGGNVLGNPDAPLKLVEYASHTCSHCAVFSQNASEPLKEYIASGVVSYEMRNLARDPLDLTIARLVRCSTPEAHHALADQSWAAFDQIMTVAQQNGQVLNQAATQRDFVTIAQATGLIDFFAARGVSAEQAAACLSDVDSINAIADKSAEQAEELGITGTPTFFLNGRELEERSWVQIEAVLQRAGARTE